MDQQAQINRRERDFKSLNFEDRCLIHVDRFRDLGFQINDRWALYFHTIASYAVVTLYGSEDLIVERSLGEFTVGAGVGVAIAAMPFAGVTMIHAPLVLACNPFHRSENEAQFAKGFESASTSLRGSHQAAMAVPGLAPRSRFR